MSILVLIVVFVVAPLALFSFISNADPEASFRFDLGGDLFDDSPLLYSLQWVIWVAVGLLAVAFWINATALREDIERQSLQEERAADDPNALQPPSPVDAEMDPLDRAIAYYEQLQYGKVRGFEGSDGRPLLLYAKNVRSTTGLLRREAAIIYPSGDSAKISAGVLYESDSWEYNSEHTIQRSRFGRAVKTKTAINRPILKALVDRNHNILTVGLASRESLKGDRTRDLQLAYARGYNLGYAV